VAEPQVLCLGEVLFDNLADQAGKPLDQVASWTAYPGGAPANVACALVKLGTPAAFIGCVGRDKAGHTLADLLESLGVDVRGLQRHSSAPTRSVFVTRTESGDRHFAGFGDHPTSQFADAFLQTDQIPTDLYTQAKFLVVGTLELAYPTTGAAVRRSLDLAEQHTLQVVMDVNWRPMFWDNPDTAPDIIRGLLGQVQYLKLSAEEADWLFETRDTGAIAARLPHLRGVLITDGERGCTYALGGHTGAIPAFPVDVEDTTGAGDAFLAGFLHRLEQQGDTLFENAESVRQWVTYASAVGALTTMRAGAIAAQPTQQEVEAFLYMHRNA